MRKLWCLLALTGFIFVNSFSAAQNAKNPEELAQEIIAAKDNRQVFSLLGQAKDAYLKDAKFNEFCDFLKSLPEKKKSLESFSRYFYSLSRYEQLKYLEEKQSWDEYFNKGNDYRQDITSGLEEVIKSTGEKDPLALYARLLLWQFHQDQQDAFAEDSLSGLLATAKVYAEGAQDIAPVKELADKLQSYDQKGKARELYKIYIDKVVNADLKDEELSGMAEKFFKDGNLELAETIYDAFIERIIKTQTKDKAVGEFFRIAREFAYKDAAASDPAYAEKIFQKAESLAGVEAFNEQTSYLRAYNLEKSGEFAQAKAKYIDLLGRFPQSAYYDKINFKLGIISAYALRDIKDAREYFQKLAGKETSSPEVISSLYQLGLLAQWEDDLERARANFLKLKEKAGVEFKSTLALAEDRLKEIADNKLLDGNIRSFLDVSLKDEYSSFNMSKLELKSSAYNLKKNEPFTLTAKAYPPESGCMQVSLEYVWVGDLGKASPTPEDSSFSSSYPEAGTKFVGLLVRTSAGVIDRAINLLDVE
jgi:TolA-binding protein